ncbi:MAG: TorD/DmsD family molecular chaperone [Pseudomonadota bacterium]
MPSVEHAPRPNAATVPDHTPGHSIRVHELILRAERALCLARALLPPQDVQQREALRDFLADDLEALSNELGENPPAVRDVLRQAIPHAFSEPGTVLRSYADLFLTPPVPAHLNTAWYQDGSLMGRHVDILRAWYDQHGLQRAEDFRDLPDHASMQLEFLAFLYAKAAEQLESEKPEQAQQTLGDIHGFLGAFPANWFPPLRRDVAHCVEGPDTPERFYLAILDWLGHAFIADRAWLTRLGIFAASPPADKTAAITESPALGEAAPVDSAQAQAFIIEQLRAAGLDASHLGTPKTERDAAMGLHPMRPVQPHGKGR